MKRVCFFIFIAVTLTTGRLPGAETNAAPLATAAVLETNVLHLRVTGASAGLVESLGAATAALPGTNRFIGSVLDLRFADGAADAVVKPTVQWFAARKQPLAVLVNSETRGAAATLAAALRAARLGLVFGSEGVGVSPDIAVAVPAAAEKVYFADAYAVLTNSATLTATNLAGRETNRFFPRISEADLVRARRAGAADPEAELDAIVPGEVPLPRKVVRDPVLARAVDLLQALAIIQERRSK